jgi:uncharacterized protein YecE (DUF72 family)
VIFILLDEGVSPKIAEFAGKVGIPQGVVLDTATSMGQRATPDQDWMTLLSKRGSAADRKVAFSADSFTDAERALAETLKVTLFSTPRMFWRPLRRLGQAAYFLRWLPRMLEMTATHPAGSQFRLPSHFNTASVIRPLPSIIGRKTVRTGRPAKPRAPAAAPLFDKRR